jgi:uncharacterized protein YndB with AHSA1/START domain
MMGMHGPRTTMFSTPSETEVAIVRFFPAPRRIVFDAWTNPRHIPQWMGPRTWTMTVCDIDLRPGGAYRWVWHNDEGAQMGISGVYREVDPPARLVTTESWDGWIETVNTLELTDEGERTTATLTMEFPSQEARDAALATNMREGMAEGYERLDAYLANLPANLSE